MTRIALITIAAIALAAVPASTTATEPEAGTPRTGAHEPATASRMASSTAGAERRTGQNQDDERHDELVLATMRNSLVHLEVVQALARAAVEVASTTAWQAELTRRADPRGLDRQWVVQDPTAEEMEQAAPLVMNAILGVTGHVLAAVRLSKQYGIRSDVMDAVNAMDNAVRGWSYRVIEAALAAERENR